MRDSKIVKLKESRIAVPGAEGMGKGRVVGQEVYSVSYARGTSSRGLLYSNMVIINSVLYNENFVKRTDFRLSVLPSPNKRVASFLL